MDESEYGRRKSRVGARALTAQGRRRGRARLAPSRPRSPREKFQNLLSIPYFTSARRRTTF
jgi:hypothetical protein